jgi:hypothetical protein
VTAVRSGSRSQRGSGHSGARVLTAPPPPVPPWLPWRSTTPVWDLRRQGHKVKASLQLAGKLDRRGHLNGKLVHIEDLLSGSRFLINTGAGYSIFPHHSSDPPTGPHLTGPSGQHTGCWGERQ